MPLPINRRWLLAQRPAGLPDDGTFRLAESPAAPPEEGQVLLRTLWLSVDPYMRGRLRDVPSYAPAVGLGETMVGGVVAEVLESRAVGFQPGDIVEGALGWQIHPTLTVLGTGPGSAGAEGQEVALRKVDPTLASVSTALGVLGMPGMTAYFGLTEVGQPAAGETVAVSAAAGAVGALVGQIARLLGCRVVGIAGSEAKCAYLREELGFDAVIDHSVPDLDAALAAACPDGVDVYFDNVGGPLLDAVLRHINLRARIVICGMIAEANLAAPDLAPRPTRHLLVKRARMQGMIIYDWQDRFPQGIAQLAAWIRSGQLRYREDVLTGFETLPQAFLRLFSGENFGKQLVKVV